MIDFIIYCAFIFPIAFASAQLGIAARKSIYSSRKVGKYDD